jgi:hypothetical protein
MRPGGTNLRALGDLRRCSQAPYPYDAYPPPPIQMQRVNARTELVLTKMDREGEPWGMQRLRDGEPECADADSAILGHRQRSRSMAWRVSIIGGWCLRVYRNER